MTSPPPLPSPPAIFIQPSCHLHRFHRPSSSIHLSSIVERPERLRAIYTGLATALARLDLLSSAHALASAQAISAPSSSDDLVKALEGLGISKPTPVVVGDKEGVPTLIVCEPAGGVGGGDASGWRKVLRSKAVKFVHEPEEDVVVGEGGGQREDRYLEQLTRWGEDAAKRLKEGKSEIPAGLPQGDLYLCPESLLAISGALSTTTQAVDTVVRSSKASSTTSFPFSSNPSSTQPPSSLNNGSTSIPTPLPSQPLSTPPIVTPQLQVQASTAFCAIRPPGHHCGEDDPMGFCFVNNVLVGAAHAYLEHDIDRAIVLDIDLHHGNGTQDIALRLNADTHHEELLIEGGKPPAANGKRGMKVFYGSVHDIYSFPCEDGNIDRIKDASISLASHGQFIENIHLTTYTSEQDFYARCYPRYLSLLTKAGEFLDATGGTEEKTIIFISAGFDASEHEDPGMQRHGGHVPTSFYARFHSDVVRFARSRCQGRVVSVLEGGYGDRALCSGALASLVGLADGGDGVKMAKAEEEGWWSLGQLVKLEKATKPTRSKRAVKQAPTFPLPSSSASSDHDPWLSRTIEILHSIETNPLFPQSNAPLSSASNSPSVAAAGGRTLRDRSAIPRTEKAGGGSAGAEVGGGSPKKKKAPLVAAVPRVVGGGAAVKVEESVVVASVPSPSISTVVPILPPPAPAPIASIETPLLTATIPTLPPTQSSALPAFVNASLPPPAQPTTSLPTFLPSQPAEEITQPSITHPDPPNKILLKFLRPAGAPLHPDVPVEEEVGEVKEEEGEETRELGTRNEL